MLRNHMLCSSNQRTTGQVRRRVSRMSAATLPAVRMALFCNIACGLYDILWPYLWCEWHYYMISVVWMALLYDLHGVNGIIVWSLWCEWHYCVISVVWMALLYDLCGVNGIIVWSLVCVALFYDLTCGVNGNIVWSYLWCVWHYSVIFPVVCVSLCCDLTCGV